MFITLTKTAREYLISQGYDNKYGARPLRRVIQKEVEDPLSQEILKGKISSGDQITLELKGGKPHLKIKKLKVEAEKVRG